MTQARIASQSADACSDWAEFAHRLCMRFPDVEHLISHGAPNYRIARGKIFALFALNHHSDGRAALWLNAATGAHERFEATKGSERYFVPPYVGVRGWLGLDLNMVEPNDALERVREAYLHTLPERKRTLVLPKLAAIVAPSLPEDPRVTILDPLQSELASVVVEKLRTRFAKALKVHESSCYGMPCWRAGSAKSSKAFLMLFEHQKQLALMLNAGAELQSWVLQEQGFFLPNYFGARGWVGRVLVDEHEIDALDDLITGCYEQVAPATGARRAPKAMAKMHRTT